MRIYKYETLNSLLEDTSVPNVFLELYLPHLSGNCVRVYLYAWMHSFREQIISNEGIAKTLGMHIEDVLAAWTELENEALIRRIYHSERDELNFDISFADLRGSMFAPEAKSPSKKSSEGSGRARGKSPTVRRLTDNSVRELFLEIEKITKRPFPSGDYQKIAELLVEFDIEPDLIARAYGYCVGRGRNPSAAYVREIIRDWSGKGIRTSKEADDHIEVIDMRFGVYRKIMRALGLSPQSLTDAEKSIFDIWLDDYAMSVDDILAATEKAAGKQNKFDYVRKVIDNEQERAGAGASGAGRGRPDRKKYYADKRRKNEETAEQRRAEVLAALPRVAELEDRISRLNMELASISLSTQTDRGAGSARLSAEISALVSEKEKVMASGGYAPDYMDVRYDCELCMDTGILDSGASCRCFEAQ